MSNLITETKEQLRDRILAQRMEIVSALENERGTKVITLVHRREPWEERSKNDGTAHLTIEDSEHVLSQIRSTPSDKLPQQAAVRTAEFLSGGYLSHDTPIMFDAARNLGLPVNPNVPGKVYELFETCGFGPCQRPELATYETAGPRFMTIIPKHLS